MIHSVERSVVELTSYMTDSERSVIAAAVLQLKNTLQGVDVAAIQKDNMALAQASMMLGAMFYDRQGRDRIDPMPELLGRSGNESLGASKRRTGKSDEEKKVNPSRKKRGSAKARSEENG